MYSAGHPVEVVLDDREPQRVEVQGRAFGQPASQQPVGVLVGGPLPEAVGVAEVDLDAERLFDVGPAGHFASLVPGEGADQPGGLAGERRGHSLGDLGRPVPVGQRHDQGVAADALDESRRGSSFHALGPSPQPLYAAR